MTLEVLEVLVVVQGVVPDGIVLFCGGMDDGGVLVSKTGEVHTVLLRVENLHLSGHGTGMRDGGQFTPVASARRKELACRIYSCIV